MRRWNVLLTAQPGPGAVHALLSAVAPLGEFHPTSFKYVCAGWVENQTAFLDALLQAQQAGKAGVSHLARAVPLVLTFEFSVDTLAERLGRALERLADRMDGGTFFVRIERRGRAHDVRTAQLEPALADRLFELMRARGQVLRTDFGDPDYIVAIETLEGECGVALLPRELRRHYPFVRVR